MKKKESLQKIQTIYLQATLYNHSIWQRFVNELKCKKKKKQKKE